MGISDCGRRKIGEVGKMSKWENDESNAESAKESEAEKVDSWDERTLGSCCYLKEPSICRTLFQ